MILPNSTMAQEIAQAAIPSGRKRTGHEPKSVTVVFPEFKLVFMRHGPLSAVGRPWRKTRPVSPSSRISPPKCSPPPLGSARKSNGSAASK